MEDKRKTSLQASTLRIGAVVLAAGSASRMGSRPKCLLELDGVSLLARQLQALLDAGIESIVVVLGHYHQWIEPVARRFPVHCVANPQPYDGQTSSLRLGLQSLPRGLDAALVALADQPLLNTADIAALRQTFLQRPAPTEVVVPTVDNLPGNPVLLSQRVVADVLAAGPDYGGKQWQKAHPALVYRWQTSNEHYRLDVDSPEDIAALAERTGVQLRWPAHLA